MGTGISPIPFGKETFSSPETAEADTIFCAVTSSSASVPISGSAADGSAKALVNPNDKIVAKPKKTDRIFFIYSPSLFILERLNMRAFFNHSAYYTYKSTKSYKIIHFYDRINVKK